MSIFKILKMLLIYTFAEEKSHTSKVLFLCMVADCLTFALPWLRKFGTKYYFLLVAFVVQITIILNLCELMIYIFAESRYIALENIFLGKFTDGSIILLPL